ncbi:MAG TPA: UDP-N-acetylmuramoyl-tripeptide--D-alanyl-D-alanine ligase [Acidimicrobiales bacterium]|nr:UDP-N-acetylmuramoyl-tripeptide--D-alanyl-D-alanine ligase [Acidimicrobiales bacterium]
MILRAAVEAACGLSIVAAGPRWLRVAQREHYLVDATTRFALRWWVAVPVNLVGLGIAVAGLLASSRWAAGGFATAAVIAVGPVGLSLRGRTSPLAWTRRLRTLALVWAGLEAVAVAGGIVAGQGPVAASAAALAVPALVDLACALMAPIERRLAGSHVARAAARLRRVAPTVVAITGSFGKTSTKGYVAHLVSGTRSVVASPASFNNRAGLARAVNEHLADGTEVFVAEMGTYGRGEIAELCSWIRPDVAVITAIGPVHLERFRSEDRVLEAKAEILVGAASAILVIDDDRLAALAEARALSGTRVWRVSASDMNADVCVLEDGGCLSVRFRGVEIAHAIPFDARPGNVAAAVAVALELGVPADDVVRRLATLPGAPHRLEQTLSPGGFVLLDDTYNANPAGARAALATLGRLGADAMRRVVVTPGMVELGPLQTQENTDFAAAVAAVATDLVIVGRTNRRALLAGSRRPPSGSDAPRVVVVSTLPKATQWVREHLESGDVVLYENDLPDHYP